MTYINVNRDEMKAAHLAELTKQLSKANQTVEYHYWDEYHNRPIFKIMIGDFAVGEVHLTR